MNHLAGSKLYFFSWKHLYSIQYKIKRMKYHYTIPLVILPTAVNNMLFEQHTYLDF